MNYKIYGVDAATEDDNTGIVVSEVSMAFEILALNTIDTGLQSILRELDKKNNNNTFKILAIDTPLGWPHKFGEIISNHDAGQAISSSSDTLFSRVVENYLRYFTCLPGKPKEIAADKIARTTHSVLNKIHQSTSNINVNVISNENCELSVDHLNILEVYPATLKNGNLTKVHIESTTRLIEKYELQNINGHQVDAIYCLLAAMQFLKRNVLYPRSLNVPLNILSKEGWIWFDKEYYSTIKNPKNHSVGAMALCMNRSQLITLSPDDRNERATQQLISQLNELGAGRNIIFDTNNTDCSSVKLIFSRQDSISGTLGIINSDKIHIAFSKMYFNSLDFTGGEVCLNFMSLYGQQHCLLIKKKISPSTAATPLS